MLMPIVSMNKMAMNESVATTCCYREVATPTAVYWEVLNGGWIGSGYVEKGDWDSDELKAMVTETVWRNFGDIYVAGDPITLTGLRDAVNGGVAPSWGMIANEQGWVANGTGGLVFVSDLKKGHTYFAAGVPAWYVGKSCAHTDPSCGYWDYSNAWTENQHFESTTAHTTGGTQWAKPHGVTQFSS